jgi:WD40 repeat protein
VGDYQVEYRHFTNGADWRLGHFTLVPGGGIMMGNAWGLETFTPRLPQPEPRSEFLGHGCQAPHTIESCGIWDLAFSPTESVVASAGGDGTVKIWNWRERGKGKPIATLNHGSHVRGLAFSPDGQVLVSVGFNGMARVWRVATTSTVTSLQMGAGLFSVCFAPDGENLFVGGGKGLVEMWNWKTGRRTGQFQGHAEDVVAIAVSPDGTRLATSSYQDAQIHLWSVGTREILQSLSEPHRPAGAGLAFSRDGKILALGGSGGVVRYCNVNSGGLTSKIPLTLGVGSLAFSPDDTKLAVAGAGYSLRIYDAKMGGLINDIDAHWNYIPRVAFSPDGTILGTASLDNSVRLWEVSKLPKVSSEKLHNSLGLSLHRQGK